MRLPSPGGSCSVLFCRNRNGGTEGKWSLCRLHNEKLLVCVRKNCFLQKECGRIGVFR